MVRSDDGSAGVALDPPMEQPLHESSRCTLVWFASPSVIRALVLCRYLIHNQVPPALEAAGITPAETSVMFERNTAEFLAVDGRDK